MLILGSSSIGKQLADVVGEIILSAATAPVFSTVPASHPPSARTLAARSPLFKASDSPPSLAWGAYVAQICAGANNIATEFTIFNIVRRREG